MTEGVPQIYKYAKQQQQPDTSIVQIRQRASQIIEGINEDASEDDVREVVVKMTALIGAMKDIEKEYKEALRIWLKAKNTRLTIGSMEYRIGGDREVKPRDKVAILTTIMDLAAGDVEKMAELLSSDPFKQGSIRKMLKDDDRFNELFEVIEKGDQDKLQIVNTEFLKR